MAPPAPSRVALPRASFLAFPFSQGDGSIPRWLSNDQLPVRGRSILPGGGDQTRRCIANFIVSARTPLDLAIMSRTTSDWPTHTDHDHLCTDPSVVADIWCLSCAQLQGVRLDERLRLIERITDEMPTTSSRDDIIELIRAQGKRSNPWMPRLALPPEDVVSGLTD